MHGPDDNAAIQQVAGDRIGIGPVELVDASHLTQVGLRPEAVVERQGQVTPAQNVDIPLKLAPSLQPPGRVIGTLIEGKDAMRLKQLVYLLPPSMLRSRLTCGK